MEARQQHNKLFKTIFPKGTFAGDIIKVSVLRPAVTFFIF